MSRAAYSAFVDSAEAFQSLAQQPVPPEERLVALGHLRRFSMEHRRPIEWRSYAHILLFLECIEFLGPYAKDMAKNHPLSDLFACKGSEKQKRFFTDIFASYLYLFFNSEKLEIQSRPLSLIDTVLQRLLRVSHDFSKNRHFPFNGLLPYNTEGYELLAALFVGYFISDTPQSIQLKLSMLVSIIRYCQTNEIKLIETEQVRLFLASCEDQLFFRRLKRLLDCLPKGDPDARRLAHQLLKARDLVGMQKILFSVLNEYEPAAGTQNYTAIALQCLVEFCDASAIEWSESVTCLRRIIENPAVFSSIVHDEAKRRILSERFSRFVPTLEEQSIRYRSKYAGNPESIEIFDPTAPSQRRCYVYRRSLGTGTYGRVFVFQETQHPYKEILVKAHALTVGKHGFPPVCPKDVINEMRCFRAVHPDGDFPYRVHFLRGPIIKDRKSFYALHTMKHLPGISIHEFFKKFASNKKMMLRALLAVAEAIQKLNRAGVVHLDLNDNNVLIDYQKSSDDCSEGVITANIIDFGLAVFLGRFCPAIMLEEKTFNPVYALPPEVYDVLHPAGVKASKKSNAFFWVRAQRRGELNLLDPIFSSTLLPDPQQRPTIEAIIAALNCELEQLHCSSLGRMPLSENRFRQSGKEAVYLTGAAVEELREEYRKRPLFQHDQPWRTYAHNRLVAQFVVAHNLMGELPSWNVSIFNDGGIGTGQQWFVLLLYGYCLHTYFQRPTEEMSLAMVPVLTALLKHQGNYDQLPMLSENYVRHYVNSGYERLAVLWTVQQIHQQGEDWEKKMANFLVVLICCREEKPDLCEEQQDKLFSLIACQDEYLFVLALLLSNAMPLFSRHAYLYEVSAEGLFARLDDQLHTLLRFAAEEELPEVRKQCVHNISLLLFCQQQLSRIVAAEKPRQFSDDLVHELGFVVTQAVGASGNRGNEYRVAL